MENMLQGKLIFVAGAGGLLGSCLVPSLLSKGAIVIAADVNKDTMAKRLLSLHVDITQESLILKKLDITSKESIERIYNCYDGIDGAINTTYPRNKTYGKHFFDVTQDSFNENISLHLGSAFLFTQQSAAYFKRSKRSFSLVNMSSIYGVVAPKFEIYNDTSMTMPVEYAAIKAAIQSLDKYTVAYVNDSRFRINCVSPGGLFDNQPEEFLKAYKKQTHGTGMLDAKDILGTIIFLLSEQSRFITGQNIIIDDGFSL